jgi:excisionase family DNA binding protein
MEQLLNTINGTFDRCQRENIGISKNLLRSLVKSNTIPYVKVGNNQTLINFEVLKAFLFTGNATAAQPQPAGQIRPIPEKIQSIR